MDQHRKYLAEKILTEDTVVCNLAPLTLSVASTLLTFLR